jgi:hypothetical protein
MFLRARRYIVAFVFYYGKWLSPSLLFSPHFPSLFLSPSIFLFLCGCAVVLSVLYLVCLFMTQESATDKHSTWNDDDPVTWIYCLVFTARGVVTAGVWLLNHNIKVGLCLYLFVKGGRGVQLLQLRVFLSHPVPKLGSHSHLPSLSDYG